MPKRIPFGPGHPDYDNQLSLFDETGDPLMAPCNPLTSRNATGNQNPASANQVDSQPDTGRPNHVKMMRVPEYWQCQDSGCLVKAKNEKQALLKLGKGKKVAPAYVEHGGYC